MDLKKFKVNENLVDSLMEVSIISLVLVGTVTFQNPQEKTALMVSIGVIVVVTVLLRIFKNKFTIIK
jgi:uncharacterized membrane protein YobD (UPF0266 family)